MFRATTIIDKSLGVQIYYCNVLYDLHQSYRTLDPVVSAFYIKFGPFTTAIRVIPVRNGNYILDILKTIS
ncbi:hypothetical protein H5410_032581 [Solanum commersonii]|uniref:Uncharacterized protein n=1 Tax=Solanum commersonii TaxID=4109 RepID=A0A9J5YKB6_SOLCO|nr:hypothetical protein H5410_032581 [Solanum commersonii]